MYGVGLNPMYLERLAERENKKQASGEARAEADEKDKAAKVLNLFSDVPPELAAMEAAEAAAKAAAERDAEEAKAAKAASAAADGGGGASASLDALMDGSSADGAQGAGVDVGGVSQSVVDALFAEDYGYGGLELELDEGDAPAGDGCTADGDECI